MTSPERSTHINHLVTPDVMKDGHARALKAFAERISANLNMSSAETKEAPDIIDTIESAIGFINQKIGAKHIGRKAYVVSDRGFVCDSGGQVEEVIDSTFFLDHHTTTYEGAEMLMLHGFFVPVLQFDSLFQKAGDTRHYAIQLSPDVDFMFGVDSRPVPEDGEWQYSLHQLAHTSSYLLASRIAFHEQPIAVRRQLLGAIYQQTCDTLSFATDEEVRSLACNTNAFYCKPDSVDAPVSSYFVDQTDTIPHERELPWGVSAEIIFPELHALDVKPSDDAPHYAGIAHGTPLLALRNPEEKCWYYIPVGVIENIEIEQQ